MARSRSPANLLLAAFRRKQAHHPGYSLRALARDLGVSATFVSNMLAGKQIPPRKRLARLCFVLELDVLEKEALVHALVVDPFSQKVLRSGKKKARRGVRPRETLPANPKGLLSSWTPIAILEGLTLAPPFNEPEALRARLGLGLASWKSALADLAAAGLIREKDGKWEKSQRHVYVATGRSREEVRRFHDQMIQKAREELLAKTTPEQFERRLITGFTFALAPEHLSRLKAKVVEFLDELSQEASEGTCEEVYQCNFQLFPLTKPPA